MNKTFIFKFPKDKIEVNNVISESDSRENLIKKAAAKCGAKIDENRINGNIRVMKVRCTTEIQQTYISIQCSAYI